LIAIALGCGSRAELDGAPTVDASVVSADAGVRCDPNAPFVGIERLDSNINALGSEERDFRLTPDELHAYFTKSDATGSHIATADRDSASTPFGAASWLTSIEALSPDTIPSFNAPSISDDERTLLFAGVGGCNGFGGAVEFSTSWLCLATRTDTSSSFSTAVMVQGGGSGYVGQPYAIHGGSRVYFAFGPRDQHIAFADRVDSTDYGNMSFVPIDFSDGGSTTTLAPVLTPDELTLFFIREGVSDRIWQATRMTTSEPFTNAQPLDELGSAWATWISPDGCRLYYSRADTDGGLDVHVYVAHRAQ
jgi:hypothetical protein